MNPSGVDPMRSEMRFGLIPRMVVTACLSLGAASAFYQWETAHAWDEAAEISWVLARQVASQAEGLAFAARERGESDPLRWAANFLSQGADPRVVRVWKIQIPSGSTPESTRIDRVLGTFELTRLTLPEQLIGLKVSVHCDAPGFLGARSKISGDLRFLGVALALAGLLFYLMFRVLGPWNGEVDFRGLASGWVRDAKGLLLQLGLHVRDMVREAQNIAVAASKSRTAVTALRDRLHGEVREIEGVRKAHKSLGQASTQGEVLALNLVLETQQLGESGKRLGAMAEELHRYFQTVRHLSQKGENAVLSLQQALDPVVTDADEAFHALEEVFKNAQGMDGHIRGTRESIIAQAKLIQAAHGQLGSEVQEQLPALSLKKTGTDS